MNNTMKKIQELVDHHGGANVTSVMACKYVGINHPELCKRLGVRRFGEYMDKLNYEVYLSDEPKRMRSADRKQQFFKAGLKICHNMSFDEITAHTVCQEMPIAPKLFWNYFDDVVSYKTQLIAWAKERGEQIC